MSIVFGIGLVFSAIAVSASFAYVAMNTESILGTVLGFFLEEPVKRAARPDAPRFVPSDLATLEEQIANCAAVGRALTELREPLASDSDSSPTEWDATRTVVQQIASAQYDAVQKLNHHATPTEDRVRVRVLLAQVCDGCQRCKGFNEKRARIGRSFVCLARDSHGSEFRFQNNAKGEIVERV